MRVVFDEDELDFISNELKDELKDELNLIDINADMEFVDDPYDILIDWIEKNKLTLSFEFEFEEDEEDENFMESYEDGILV